MQLKSWLQVLLNKYPQGMEYNYLTQPLNKYLSDMRYKDKSLEKYRYNTLPNNYTLRWLPLMILLD
jgi:hypothetical protein